MQSLCYHRSWLQQENGPFLAHGGAAGSRQGQATFFFPLVGGSGANNYLGLLQGRRCVANGGNACVFRRPREDSVVGHGGNGFFGSGGGNGDGSGSGSGRGSSDDGEKNHPSITLPNALFLAFLPWLSLSLSPNSSFKPWPIPSGWTNLIGSLLLFISIARSRPVALAESNPNLSPNPNPNPNLNPNLNPNSIPKPKPNPNPNHNPNSNPNQNSMPNPNPNPNLNPKSNSNLNSNPNGEDNGVVVWEVKSGKWRRLVMDPVTEEFVVDVVVRSEEEALAYDLELASSSKKVAEKNNTPSLDNTHCRKTSNAENNDSGQLWRSATQTMAQCWNLIQDVMLPEGYPTSVSGDYLEYSLWRMGQGIASQVNGVLTTQALLYAVGLGKGAIPTAAAVNWVLKDGIGYLSKITLSKFGRHFDVYPKGWRLFADLLENVSYGLELLTPTFPHLFVYLGALAGAGKSAAGLIQAATRSCFYAGFAAQRNYADVIAKGEAQGMVSKSIGIMLGIAMSGYVGSSGPALVAAFVTVTAVHMFCNLKSYQAVQLRSLNPYRAYLVFGEYLRSGVVPSIAEVNAAEPVIAEVSIPLIGSKRVQDDSYHLSRETKEEALMLRKKLELGVAFKNLVRTRIEAEALSRIYQNERYILSQQSNRFLVLLKEGATAHDLLRMMLQASFLLQNHARFGSVSHGVVVDCGESGILKRSYDFMQNNFDKVKDDLQSAGWIVDGLVSRPSSHRLLMKSFFEGSHCI